MGKTNGIQWKHKDGKIVPALFKNDDGLYTTKREFDRSSTFNGVRHEWRSLDDLLCRLNGTRTYYDIKEHGPITQFSIVKDKDWYTPIVSEDFKSFWIDYEPDHEPTIRRRMKSNPVLRRLLQE